MRHAARRGHRHGGHHPGSFLYHSLRIFESISLFFFIMTFVVIAVFLMGNYQEFQDTTQFLLLGILRVIAVLCSLTSAYYVVTLSVWSITRRHLLPFRFAYALLAVVLGVGAMATTSFLAVMVAPAS
jgi:hypothetical protein